MNKQSIFSQESSATLCRPWTIVRILPNAQTYIVARFFNRQDADDHLKFLRRFVPKAVFEIMFEPPNTEYQDDNV
ncbi:hypothetical protein H6G64_24420 [Calothrix sp. FACHB-156]|nr:hypothetical protein [Calothrix sp. FACHB-156]